MPIYLWEKSVYQKEEKKIDHIIFLVTGFLLALALYQILIGLFLKIKENVILGFLIGIVALILLNLMGVLLEYWPFKNYTSILRFLVVLYPVFGILFGRFSKAFCIKNKYNIFSLFEVINVCLFFITVFVPFSIMGYLAACILSFLSFEFIFIIVSAVSCYKLGQKDSLFFIFSFSPTMISFFLRILQNLEIMSDSILTRYGALISFPVTLLLFASAIIYRFNLIQNEVDRQKKLTLKNLENTSKMKDLFLSSTAHELRTPLNGIIGLSESVLIDDSQKLTDKARANLSAVSASAWRLSRLVNDILDHTKGTIEELYIEKKNINIGQLIEVVLVNLSPLFSYKPVIVRNLNKFNSLCVIGDENRIQQILFNLLGNAIKFTHRGEISVSTQIQQNEIWICIKDTGIGIPEERLESIFKLYNQGSDDIIKKYGGTGLGLALSKQLVELHGGHIWAESKVGIGSSFYFTLPIAENISSQNCKILNFEESNSIFKPTDNITLNSFDWKHTEDGLEKILAVDDEPVNLQVIENYLPKDKYLIYSMTSGVNLMEIIKESISLELVILDIYMPEISGYELCSQIRKRYKSHELPVLMLTASSNLEDMVQAFSLGANDYITKPVSREELLARVETHIKLKKSIERNSFTNKKLNEIDRLISLGFMATSFVLKNKISIGQENIVLEKAYDYYRPILDQLLVSEEDNSELSNNFIEHSYFEKITEKLHSLEQNKILNFLIKIKESIQNSNDTIFKEDDIERISTDIFDLIGSLLQFENPIVSSETSILNEVGLLLGFTPKEMETTILIYEGYTNQEISHKMGVALNTVKQHIYHIFNKVGVENRTHLIFKMLNKK